MFINTDKILRYFVVGLFFTAGMSSVSIKQPANEWGPCYSLPVNSTEIDKLFEVAYADAKKNHQDVINSQCGDRLTTVLHKWYISTKNESHILLNYQCPCFFDGCDWGEYSMKVDRITMKPIEFGKLIDFKIVDSEYNWDDYDATIEEERIELRKKAAELLAEVADEIALQKWGTSQEMCPDPKIRPDTFYVTKKENQFEYSKFKINCNVSMQFIDDFEDVPTQPYTYIEVVTDKEFKVFNDGSPALAYMYVLPWMYEARQKIDEAESVIPSVDARSTLAANSTDGVTSTVGVKSTVLCIYCHIF